MRIKPHMNFDINKHAYQEISPYLYKKDGLKHILVLSAFSKITDKAFECEERITEQLNDFLVHMQCDAYELLDVKVSPIANQSVIGSPSGFTIVILYS